MEMFMFENNKKKWSSVYPMLEEKGDKEKYEKFFRAALKKFGANSPADLSPEKKKEFYNYVDKNYKGDHEQDNPNAESVQHESHEVGTRKYTDYLKSLTPGQNDIKQNEDNERNGLQEKAVSQQQQKLMGLAYAVKKGEISAPSPEIQKIADSMSEEELKKMAEGKHKDLPVKKEEKCPHCMGEGCEKCNGTGELPDEAEGGEMPDTHTPGIHKKESKSVKEVNFAKLDGRRKEFKEKVRQLYYEKIRKDQETSEAKKEETKKANKISINPELKEYKGYDLAKKFFKKPEDSLSEEEEKILSFIKESDVATSIDIKGTLNPMSGEQSVNMDSQPASVMTISRMLKISPMRVQSILDKMVAMGTVQRVGDAYSYGKTEVAN